MRNKFRSLLPVVLFLYLMILPACMREALGQDGKTFLWKVDSKASTVYMLGSIHLLKKESYPLSQKIERAFEKSDTLVVEADIRDEGKKTTLQIMERASYPENDSIEKHLSPETYELLQKEAANLGLPLDLISGQKPWFVAMALEAMELLHLGYDPRYGIDSYFLSKATGRKKILEIEGLDEQIKMVADLSDREQELLLLLTLKDQQTIAQDADQLVRAWQSGDTKKMQAIIAKSTREDPSLLPIYEKLFNDRNRKMVSKIEDYLKGKGIYFVIVGAGHMIGEKGIVETLRKKGYRVEQF